MTTLLHSSEHRPWYREGSVWLIIAFPVIAIIGCAITIVIAIASSDGLVADDYYKQGLAINQTIARDEEARALGLKAVVRLRDGEVRVSLEAQTQMPESVLLTLVHPTRAGEDQALQLKRSGEDYVAPFTHLSAGRWNIRLEDESRSWRMICTVQFPTETTVRISGG